MREESIFIIEANNEERAAAAALAQAKAAEVEYDAVTGRHVTWVAERVEQVYEILDPELKSGTEVFSRFLEGY